MQTRPYDEKDGLRIWLNGDEQQRFLDAVEDDPRRKIAFQLGLHGLRSDEILRVQPNHFRDLGDERAALRIPDGKTGRRQSPVSSDLRTSVRYWKNAAQARADEPIFDVTRRTLRNWIADARGVLAERPLLELGVVLGWPYVGMVAAVVAGHEPDVGLVAGVLVSLLSLGYIRLRVSTERLRELQREPVAALDEPDRGE